MEFELLIRNATLIDGTRAPRFEADIGVSSGRISSIGKLKEKGEIEIDASGKIAAPGFIDAHTHDDRLMLSAPAAGAIGFSTGLYYEPARAAPTEEVIEVCRPLTARKGIYCTHMRDEGDRIVDSLEETFRIGRELGVPVVVSHHKLVGSPNHGRSAETLPIIEKAMRSQRIGLDCYPYCASSTILSVSRLAARGVLKEGFAADIVVFDENEIDEAASFAKPIQRAKGIDTVIVNGAVVWREGKSTGARPGRVLARTA